MKNFLAYTNPLKQFDDETATLVKVHIDNSLELGWKREDILLFTNFEYEYNGIKATVVPNELRCFDKTSNKIFVIEYLLRKDMLEDDLYWYHDFDAYQNELIDESELGLEGFNLGLTKYGYKDQINGGSFFFRKPAYNIFKLWSERLLEIRRTRADEKTMTDMIRSGEMDSFRYKILNITYNFGQKCPNREYDNATKPLKVLHFHPHYWYYGAIAENLDNFMYGNNKIGIPMMSERLIKIFNNHGIR